MTKAVAAKAADEQSPRAIYQRRRESAERLVTLLTEKRFDDVIEQFDPALKKALPASKLEALWQELAAAYGRFRSRPRPLPATIWRCLASLRRLLVESGPVEIRMPSTVRIAFAASGSMPTKRKGVRRPVFPAGATSSRP